jgi:hypothetical protein
MHSPVRECDASRCERQSTARALKALPLVTTLRQQIRRGAAFSLLVRLVGAEAEYRRLAKLYRLDAPIGASKVPPPHFKAQTLAQSSANRSRREPLHGRQANLLAMLSKLAEVGEVFPGSHALGEALECSWLVIERDLGRLTRQGFIRLRKLHSGGTVIERRWEIVRTGRSLLVPYRPGASRPGGWANGVREGV